MTEPSETVTPTDESTRGAGRPDRLASVAEVVARDLCVGCGLCEAVTGGRVSMASTPAGSLRPAPVDGFTAEEELLDWEPRVDLEAGLEKTIRYFADLLGD